MLLKSIIFLFLCTSFIFSLTPQEQALLDEDPLAYCEEKVGEQVQYKANLKRCETLQERDIRLIKEDPVPYCEELLRHNQEQYKLNVKYCDPILNERDKELNIVTVDTDGDGLIEIKDATMLDNIRYSLEGTSYKTKVDDIENNRGCPHHICKGYELSNNVDLKDINWTPIGDKNFPFRSSFNGNGYEIQNLTIDSIVATEVGLFGSMVVATISNVGLVNVSIKASSHSGTNVGGLVGIANSSTISHSYVNVSIKARGDGKPSGTSVGGLIGAVNGASTITISHSYVTGNISSSRDVGGLIGAVNGASTITISHSYVTGNISSSRDVGGLIGGINGATITISNSYTTVNISYDGYAVGSFTGGLIGAVNGASTVTISNSCVVGNISSYRDVGGLIGGIHSSTITISNSYTTVDISSDGYAVGGLVGIINGDVTIRYSYTKGNISSSSIYAAGLVGVINSGAITIRHSYTTGNVSGKTIGSLVGKIKNGVTTTIRNSVYKSDAIFTEGDKVISPNHHEGIIPITEHKIKQGSGQVVNILSNTIYKFIPGSFPKVYKEGITTELVPGQ